ncbi:uncharacterized protein LOC116209986 [Punica granatum]|uniref:Uncharacterized protein n=2 Tax=Punica granatum TaxID=22663 RepID=A0A218XJK1_PUNGR|nr:uncharacterized protein LOC116209986 [Punica granatum]OWM85375.1 hypothetical protein CDL15_Pgr018999 [Punica granatum]PKI74079.1 hypothetical protein CRG98_005557 [Punica granatum]
METNLLRKSQHFLPFNPIFDGESSFRSSHIVLNKAQSTKPVIFSGKRKRRNGSQRLVKFVLESIPVVASSLKILPQPLDVIVGELIGGGDGNRGGWGFRRSFGSDGWFDGWRRRGTTRKLGFWWVIPVFGLGLVLGREVGSDLILMYCVLGLGLFSFALVELRSRKAIRDGILGLCCFGILAIFGLRAEAMKNWVRDFQVRSPSMKRFKGGRRKSRAL